MPEEEILYKVPQYGREIELRAVISSDNRTRMSAEDMKKINVQEGEKIDLIGPRTVTVQVYSGANLGEIHVPKEVLDRMLVRECVYISVRKSIFGGDRE